MNKGNKRVLITQINIYRSVLILLFICIVATILSENPPGKPMKTVWKLFTIDFTRTQRT